jgi:hypothetical protein
LWATTGLEAGDIAQLLTRIVHAARHCVRYAFHFIAAQSVPIGLPTRCQASLLEQIGALAVILTTGHDIGFAGRGFASTAESARLPAAALAI